MPKIDEYHSDASEVESDNYDDDGEVAASDDLPQEAWEAAGFPEGGLPPSALNFTVKPGDTLLDKIPGSSLTDEVDPELQMGETFRAIMLVSSRPCPRPRRSLSLSGQSTHGELLAFMIRSSRSASSTWRWICEYALRLASEQVVVGLDQVVSMLSYSSSSAPPLQHDSPAIRPAPDDFR